MAEEILSVEYNYDEIVFYKIRNFNGQSISIKKFIQERNIYEEPTDEDLIFSKNIFNYINDNLFAINDITCPYELTQWFDSNKKNFINKYYLEDSYILKLYIKYLFYIGVFNDDIYQNMKNTFINRNKENLEVKLIYLDNDYTKIIFKNNIYFLIKDKNKHVENYYEDNDEDNYEESYEENPEENTEENTEEKYCEIETLEQKSLDKIRKQQSLYKRILYNNSIIPDTDIDVDTINQYLLNKYIIKFKSYNLFEDFSYFFNNLKDKSTVETFFEKNNIDEKYKMFFGKDLLNKIYGKIDHYMFLLNHLMI
jgi:hypothetical protein